MLPARIVLAEDQNPLYGELLQHYVKEGQVDYIGLKKKEAQLDRYLEHLNATDPVQMSGNDQFAFYLNAYNAYTLKLILKNFENCRLPASIKDIGSFFQTLVDQICDYCWKDLHS